MVMESDPPPPPSPSFGATVRPTSPRSSTSASADLDELLLTAPPPSASMRRGFSNAVKQQCWEKAERVDGRDPERWRRDAVGNAVFRQLVGCPGCLCHDYDHIVPYSKGGKSTLENCQILQATVNRSKGNETETSKCELAQKSAYGRVSGSDMDLLEYFAYGNVRRAPDSGAPVPAAVPPLAPAAEALLSQILSVVTDIKLPQQTLEQNQQRWEKAQKDTNNRIAALTDEVSQILSVVRDIKLSQQTLEQNQQRWEEAQTVTNNRIAALTDEVHSLKEEAQTVTNNRIAALTAEVHSLKQAFATRARNRQHRRLNNTPQDPPAQD